MKRYRCIAKGKVQGVWYRKYVSQMAKEAGFKGYVRNLPDKTVEAVVDVDDEKELDTFKTILKKGSPMSIVTDVSCEEVPRDSSYATFEVIR
ncbi:acylphosphatase [Hydrogenimonas sp.]